MEKVISIHQPCYIPYLGVFYKIWSSDVFVYLDDAQYSNGYVFDWNRIKTPQGECRLKIPTERSFGQTLRQTKPKDLLGWKDKHLKTVYMNYRKASYFNEVFHDYESVLLKDYSSLSELNIAIMEMFIHNFGWQVERHISSELNLDTRSEQRVIDIVKYYGGTTYVSGTGGKNYQVPAHFADAGVNLVYSDYYSCEYRQLWGDFIPNLSVLDYCMNEGYKEIDEYFKKIRGESAIEQRGEHRDLRAVLSSVQ